MVHRGTRCSTKYCTWESPSPCSAEDMFLRASDEIISILCTTKPTRGSCPDELRVYILHVLRYFTKSDSWDRSMLSLRASRPGCSIVREFSMRLLLQNPKRLGRYDGAFRMSRRWQCSILPRHVPLPTRRARDRTGGRRTEILPSNQMQV